MTIYEQVDHLPLKVQTRAQFPVGSNLRFLYVYLLSYEPKCSVPVIPLQHSTVCLHVFCLAGPLRQVDVLGPQLMVNSINILFT